MPSFPVLLLLVQTHLYSFSQESSIWQVGFPAESHLQLLDSSDEAAAAKRFKAGELGDSSAQSFKAEQSTTSNHSGDESGSPHSMEDLNHHGLNLPLPPPDHQAPTQDYIHVRARRGQATDSHSLAERVIMTISPPVVDHTHYNIHKLLWDYLRADFCILSVYVKMLHLF